MSPLARIVVNSLAKDALLNNENDLFFTAPDLQVKAFLLPPQVNEPNLCLNARQVLSYRDEVSTWARVPADLMVNARHKSNHRFSYENGVIIQWKH